MFVGASETSVGSGTMVDHLWLAVTVTVGSVPSNSEGFSKSRFEGKAFPDDARFLTCVVRSPHSCGMQFLLVSMPNLPCHRISEICGLGDLHHSLTALTFTNPKRQCIV